MIGRFRRGRIAGLTVAVAVVVAGGAFAVLRPDGPPAPQVWRDQVAEASPASPGHTSGPPGGALGSVPGRPGSAAATGAAATGTTPTTGAVAPTSPTGAGTSTSGGRSRGPVASQSPTSTAPAGAGATAQPVKAPPAAPGWRLLPKAPIGGRVGHSAVWTGREMVVWGGMSDLDTDPMTDGAAFDPAARTWRKLSAAPLSPRFDAQAFWTGREMIVFGGTSVDGDILADGAAWNPASNAWRPLPASPLGARDGAVVAWAGDRLVVWGGATVPPPDAPGDVASVMQADGSAYVPATDRWVPVVTAPIAARSGAESVWTGTRLVISGGYHEGDEDDRTDGAALDPISGVWSPIAARPAAGSCGGDSPCAGVWAGTAALFPASGLAYDPAADRWSAVAPYPSADGPLAGEPAVWTGRRLLAWGTPSDASAAADSAADDDASDQGDDAPPAPPTGGQYDPAANRWQTVPPGPLSGRLLHTAVWTGQEMLVWGGTAGDSGLADGAAFRPE